MKLLIKNDFFVKIWWNLQSVNHEFNLMNYKDDEWITKMNELQMNELQKMMNLIAWRLLKIRTNAVVAFLLLIF